jgi:hypothetical protein
VIDALTVHVHFGQRAPVSSHHLPDPPQIFQVLYRPLIHAQGVLSLVSSHRNTRTQHNILRTSIKFSRYIAR